MRTARGVFAAVLTVTLSGCAGVSGVKARGASIPVSVALSTGRADHVVGVGDAPEGAQGTTLGFAAVAAPLPWLEFSVHTSGGTLTASENARANHDLAEVQAGVSFLVLPWLAATGGVEGRRYTGALASQKWTALRTGAEARLELASGARGIIRASVLPKVTVEGLESPTLAVGGGTGIELNRKRLFAALLYSIDRYDFPAGAAGKRVEQLSSIVLQAGWRFGR